MQYFSSDLECCLPFFHVDKITVEEYKMKLRKAIKPLIRFEKRELQSIFLSITLWRMREMKEKMVESR